MRTHRLLAGALILMGAAATVLALPWTHGMVAGPAVQPQTLALVPPANTLAIGRPRVMPPFEAAERLTNPREASAEVLAEGGALFAIYCAVCHGAGAGGDGVIAPHFPRMPDLTLDHVKQFPDGYLYSLIGRGGARMPGYAESLSRSERWALVHYVRSLR